MTKIIKVVQIGMGPLGIKMAQQIAERNSLETVAAIDIRRELVGTKLSELTAMDHPEVIIQNSLTQAVEDTHPDIAILTTVSDLERAFTQIEDLVRLGLPVVSTCEELSFPWYTHPELANKLNESAKKSHVSILGTGVNPGYLMDSLPTFLTSVCKDVKSITVNRFQDAQYRRVPFQNKIGAGLSLEEFEQKKQKGTLRHVGLTESMHFIADRMKWKLDKTEDIISPVIATEQINTKDMIIKPGKAMGVRQIGRAFSEGKEKITLIFQAAVGEPESYDEIIIHGEPAVRSKIIGGVNGDIATCAITLNVIPQLLRSTPGFKTMADIPISSFW